MGPQTTPDQRLARLAARQYGVISRAQLYEIGFGERAIARRIERGRLHRIHRGVYSVGHTIVSGHGRWLAATMATGGVLSHRSAAALWGLRPATAPRIDVAVAHTSGVRSSAGIVVHRSRRPVESLTRDRIPVTTAGRTLADLAMALPRRQLEKACEAAEALRLHVDVDPQHPGAGRLATIELGNLTESPVEDEFLALCDRYDIPGPLVNTYVEGFRVDFGWPGERLIVETDGGRHSTRAAFERDRARDALLTAVGWRVMRFTRRQVRRGPGTVASRLLSGRSPWLATPG